MPRWCFSWCLLLFLLPLQALGQHSVVMLDSSRAVNLFDGESGLFFAAPALESTSENKVYLPPQPENLDSFVGQLTPVVKFDKFVGGAYWFYAPVENPTQIDGWVLSPDNPIIEEINVYLYSDNGVSELSTGYLLPDHYDLHYGVDFDLAPGEQLKLLVLVKSRSFSGLPTFEIVSREVYKREVSVTNALIIGCFGAITILCFYNAFIGISTRDKSFIYYSLYLLVVVIAWCTVFNFSPEWFRWYDFTTWRSPFFLSITFNTLYYIHFLELPARHRSLALFAYSIAFFSLVMTFASSLLPSGVYMALCGVVSALWITCGLFGGIYCYLKGYKPARYFVLAFMVLFLGIGLLIVEPFWINNPIKNSYLITLITQTLDMLLLSLALADRINIFRQQKEQALSESVSIKHKSMLKEHMANIKLQDALQLSEEESRRKTDFLRMVSHELRTPLHSIVSSVDQWDEADDESAKSDLLSYIGYGASRLKSQVDNLVLLAETDEKYSQPNRQEFEIRPVLEKLCTGVAGLVHDRVEFYYLPSQAAGSDQIPIGFKSDAYLIEHLIRSVLENACKYTEVGRVEFIVAWSGEESALKIDIIDTGCGMTTAQQKTMYNAFVQVSRGLERDSEGLGLGLTICYRLSEILNADFVIDSDPGVGTNVQIRLPLEPATCELATIDKDVEQFGRVLIVEDNEVNAKVLEHILVSLDYQVDVVYSGQQALEQLDQCGYDVVLMDIQMPVMDGITATRWMRRRGINAPIIAITANSDSQVRRRCIEVGMNDLVVKPVRRRDIKRIVEKHLPVKRDKSTT